MNDPWKQERAFLMKAPPRSLGPDVEKALLVEAGRRILADADALLPFVELAEHKLECIQYTGPYDLGELEPACTCGLDRALAALPEHLK